MIIIQPELIVVEQPPHIDEEPVEEAKVQDNIIIVPVDQNRMPKIIEEIQEENKQEAQKNYAD